MKNWLIISALIMLLVVGCSSAPKMPGEISLSPGPNQVKAPWAGFNEGAWVQYTILSPMDGKTAEFRQSIHQIARGEATIVTATKVEGNWKMGPPERISLFPIPKSSKESTSENITVNGKELKCRVAEMPMKMGDTSTVMKMWMCDEIPGGIAQKEMGGKVVWQAVDFGLDGKAPPLEQVTEPKNYWAKFGKDSWVCYKILNPADGKEVQQKYTIIEVGKETSKVEITEQAGDKWETKGTPEVSLQPFLVPKNMGAPAVLEIAGKKVNCVCVEKTDSVGNMTTLVKEWISDEVPGGTVRKEMAGKVVKEVVDFNAVK